MLDKLFLVLVLLIIDVLESNNGYMPARSRVNTGYTDTSPYTHTTGRPQTTFVSSLAMLKIGALLIRFLLQLLRKVSFIINCSYTQNGTV